MSHDENSSDEPLKSTQLFRNSEYQNLHYWKFVLNEAIETHSCIKLEQYLNSIFFENIWIDIFNISDQTLSMKEGSYLLSSYRRLTNSFRNDDNFQLTHTQYKQLLIRSLLEAIYKNIISEYNLKIFDLIKSLTQDMQSLLLDEIKLVQLPAFLQYVDSVWCIKSLQIILRKSNKKYPNNNNNSDYNSYIKLFVKKTFETFQISEVIDELALVQPGSHDFAIALLESFSLSDYGLILERISSLWGSKLFICRGDERMQIYLTTMILYILSKIESSVLLERVIHENAGYGDLPLVVILSSGVSAYFDSPDKSSRERAMEVAKIFSSMLGNEIQFTKTDKKKEEGVKNFNNVNNNIISSNYDSDSDSDSDDDFEPYEEDDEDHDEANDDNYSRGNDKSINVVYLRNCLEMIAYPETKSNAREKHYSGLTSIPKIIGDISYDSNNPRPTPIDGADISPTLVKELLRMENCFNIDGFQELHNKAIISLVYNYPVQTVPILSQSLCDGIISMGTKLEILSYLVTVAYLLSGIKQNHSSSIQQKTTITADVTSSSNILTLEEATAVSDNCNNNISHTTNTINTKTRIKRPGKLKQLHNIQKTIQNKFSPVVTLFYYPVAHLINEYLRKNCNYDYALSSDSSSTLLNINLNGKIKNEKSKTKDSDEMDDLMLSQLLLSLGGFCRCTLNTLAQKDLATETFKYAFYCKEFSSLAIRRAALSTLLSCTESLLCVFINNNSFTNNISGSSGALEHLLDLSSAGDSHNNTTQVDTTVMSMMFQLIEWIDKSVTTDVDITLKILKAEIMKNILTIFDTLS